MSLVRILTVGDQHMDVVGPQSRTDDYLAAMWTKLEEIREIAQEREVDAILWLGDLINRQDWNRVPYWLTNKLIDYFGWGWEVAPYKYTSHLLVMGNHDIKGNSSDWHRQPIGSIVRSENVCALWSDMGDGGRHAVRVGGRDSDVEVVGQYFDDQADKPENRAKTYSHVRSKGGFLIHACHSALVPDGYAPFGDFTTLSDLDAAVPRERQADVYVAGHIHDDLGAVYEGDRLRYFNFGAIARGALDEVNLRRTVKVGLLTVDTEARSATVEAIPLKSARPASEIFAVQQLEDTKTRDNELEALAATLNAGNMTDKFRILSPEEAMRSVMDGSEIRSEVRAKVKQYVDAAMQEMT